MTIKVEMSPPVDIHGHYQKTVHKLSAGHLFFRKHITQEGAYQYGSHGSHHCTEYGNPQCGKKAAQLEYIHVVGYRKSPGQKNRIVDSCLRGITEGINDDIPERVDAYKGSQQHQGIIKYLKSNS